MESLARIIGRPIRTTQFCEGGHSVRPYVLLIGQRAPMGSKDDEDGKRERVAQDKLGHTSETHGNAAQEIIVTR